MDDLVKEAQRVGGRPGEAALVLATSAAVGALAWFAYARCMRAEKPAVAPSAPPKRETASKEELLKPFEKKAGLPEVSLTELSEALGRDGSLWLGCKGRVFDVSASPGFYGKEGGYHLFIGNDSSVALAKMKFDKEFLDPSHLHWSRDLDAKELNILEEWLQRFEGKYKLVGYIKDDGKFKV